MRITIVSIQDADGAMQTTTTCVSTVLLMELRALWDFIFKDVEKIQKRRKPDFKGFLAV